MIWNWIDSKVGILWVLFFPKAIFPQSSACLFWSHVESYDFKQQRNKTIAGHTTLITCNAEVLKKGRVVDTGVFLNMIKRIIYPRGLSFKNKNLYR